MGKWLNDLWTNPNFAARVVRSVFAGIAAGGAAFMTDIEPVVSPTVAHLLQAVCGVSALISLMIAAGDKTPENVKQLAKDVDAGSVTVVKQ